MSGAGAVILMLCLTLARAEGLGGNVARGGDLPSSSMSGLAWLEFDSSDFTRPGLIGVDRQLDLDSGATTSDYARLWIGWLDTPGADEVTIFAEADDGIRVHVGGEKLIDAPRNGGDRQGSLTGKAGRSLPIAIEFVQRGGTAHARLFWSWKNSPRALIPPSAFRHTEADLDRIADVLSGKLPVATALEQVLAQPITTVAKTAPAPLAAGESEVDFGRDIQPLLAERCCGCHGAERREGGLRLDLRRTAMQGGDSGDTIVPGLSAASRLLTRVRGEGDESAMPPDGAPLTERQIARLAAWIDRGAVWPDALAGRDTDSEHWSFQPVRRQAPPAVRDTGWVRNSIDSFVLSRLEREGIVPAPEADRFTLLRRLTLDLTGLPPTPEESRQYSEDERPDAYAQQVDRLLASPHFGERFGRHWLDLARYADSDGYENDGPRPNAWRFRDWVIGSINRDQPFDEFTIEQLAGDLLPGASPDQLIATGFHRNTLHNSAGGADREEFRTKAVKDRVDTTGAVWLGLTLNCCQCHSHKYDPIAHREYYGLYAFFNNADDTTANVPGGEASVVRPWQRTSQVHLRGNFLTPGSEVRPHTPAFLPALEARSETPDRLDLARWIVDPDNPLAARVQANHVWRHLFGAGLTGTPENFGKNGQPPTHPELLDWLAAELVELNWSRKALIRAIVTSATYRQSSSHRPELAQRDPINSLWARQNRHQLEGEVIRDAALAASGLLRSEIGGPSFQPPLPSGLASLSELKNERFVEAHGDRHRRGLYIHAQRTFPYPLLATFDAPDGNQACLCRDRSNTPIQALSLLNDPAIVECMQSLGERLCEQSADAERRLRSAWPLCLGRPASEAELAAMRELVAELQRQGLPESAVWTGVARTLLNLDEFISRE